MPKNTEIDKGMKAKGYRYKLVCTKVGKRGMPALYAKTQEQIGRLMREWAGYTFYVRDL